jgi:hypothetical protein
VRDLDRFLRHLVNMRAVRGRAPAWSAGVAICALLAACGGKPQSTGGAPSSAAGAPPPMAQSDTSSEFHHDDPCSLLEPKEVEAAFGAPLGTAPYRGSNLKPVADGSDCVYQTASFQTVTLSVSFTDGQQAYHVGDFVGSLVKGAKGAVDDKTKKVMVSEDGSEIAGEWDEAKLTPLTCCSFNALRADQMIGIDFTGSAMALTQAAALVDAAFKRIDKPLTLDGGANAAAAKAFLKTRPTRMAACSVLSQAEAEAILGKLVAAPKEQGDSCSYQLPSTGIPQIYELDYGWQGGNYDFRQDLQAAKMAGSALGNMGFNVHAQVQVPNAPAAGAQATGEAGSSASAAGTHTQDVTEHITVDEATKRMSGQTFAQTGHLTGEQDASSAGPWERSATIGPKLEAVKKDVLVKIDLRAVDQDKAKALLTAAMKKF